ncbi:phage regulator Rha-like protein [Providencia alcalifaciens]|nr:phage regulator Rha-like protein [Providencia alcalifaciens]
MNDLINTNASMTSKEIAELVGSREDSVKRTIERLVDKGIISKPPMVNGIKTANGVTPQHYLFSGEEGKRDSIIVVAQLSPEFTARLVDRWKELENERLKPKSQAEIIAAMALANLDSERRILSVEHKVEQVHETVEQIKQGFIPIGYVSYPVISNKAGITKGKCRTLVNQFDVPEKIISALSPDGVPFKMKVVLEDDFMVVFHSMMCEAEKRGTRWYHPKMGIFQVIGWEAK